MALPCCICICSVCGTLSVQTLMKSTGWSVLTCEVRHEREREKLGLAGRARASSQEPDDLRPLQTSPRTEQVGAGGCFSEASSALIPLAL